MLIPFLIFTALPPPSRDSSHKPVFERLSIVAAEERSAKFLLTDELLHRFELLHSSRSTQLHEVPTEVPDSPMKTPDAPVSIKEHMRGGTSIETSLVKCSIPKDVAGPSDKSVLAPVIEEEEPPRSSEKSTNEGVKKASPKKHDGDDVFEGLSDLIVTSQELFKDDVSKTISSVIEATSSLQQMSTPPTQVITTSIPQSGL